MVFPCLVSAGKCPWPGETSVVGTAHTAGGLCRFCSHQEGVQEAWSTGPSASAL